MSELQAVPLGEDEAAEALAINAACPIQADFTFTFERDPDFFRWPRSVFETFRYWGVRDAGRLVGYMMLAANPGWTGEGWGRFGYGGDARVLPDYRRRGVARTLVEALRTDMPDDVEVGFSIVKVGNQPVENALTAAHPRRDEAWDMQSVGLFRAHNVFFVPSGRTHAARVRPATPADLEPMLALLEAQHRGRLFAPRPDRERLQSALSTGAVPEGAPTYWVAEQDGALVGTLGVWDLDPMHRVRVLKRTPKAQLSAVGYRAYRLLHPRLTPLPAAGGVFRVLCVLDVAMRDRDPEVLSAMLDSLIEHYQGRGLHFVQIGFMDGDPLARALDGLRSVRFESNLGVWYRTAWLERVGTGVWRDPYVDLTLL